MKQFVLTTAMGKRLIGKAMAVHPAIQEVLKKGTLVIVAGTTNGYVAEEIFKVTGQKGFNRKGFRRGVVMAPAVEAESHKADFPGDVVLLNGAWQRGKEVFDVIDDMKAGDVVLKGGNALDLATGQSAVLIGHPMCGTAGACIPAVIGRRVRMIVPIGLEKRIYGSIADLANLMNDPQDQGPRLMPLPGKAFTELDAIALLTGARAAMVSAGGIYGAEGSVRLAVTGSDQQLADTAELIQSIKAEEPCEV